MKAYTVLPRSHIDAIRCCQIRTRLAAPRSTFNSEICVSEPVCKALVGIFQFKNTVKKIHTNVTYAFKLLATHYNTTTYQPTCQEKKTPHRIELKPTRYKKFSQSQLLPRLSSPRAITSANSGARAHARYL